jgi:hypothetical protein
LLHHGDMGNVANVSEVHAAPPGSKCVGWWVCVYTVLFWKMGEGGGDKVVIGAPSGPVGTVDQESCADSPFKGLGVHQKSHQQLMLSYGHPSMCSTECYIYKETHQPTHFDPEDGGGMYLRHIGITYIHVV